MVRVLEIADVKKLTPLSPDAKRARMPIPPEDLVGAMDDTVHKELSETRAVKTVKGKPRRNP